MSESKRALTKVTIHASLVRVLTFMGGDRKLVIGGVFVCVYLAFIFSLRYGPWYGIPMAGACWFVWIAILRKMASKDPMMWQIIKRQWKYRSFYPARGRMDAKLRSYKDFNKG